jgi:hypothetical protein
MLMLDFAGKRDRFAEGVNSCVDNREKQNILLIFGPGYRFDTVRRARHPFAADFTAILDLNGKSVFPVCLHGPVLVPVHIFVRGEKNVEFFDARKEGAKTRRNEIRLVRKHLKRTPSGHCTTNRFLPLNITTSLKLRKDSVVK